MPMWETALGAVIAAIISAGSAAAMQAAHRATETRDIVLVLKEQVEALNKHIERYQTDTSHRLKILDGRASALESRVTTIEVLIQRHTNDKSDHSA